MNNKRLDRVFLLEQDSSGYSERQPWCQCNATPSGGSADYKPCNNGRYHAEEHAENDRLHPDNKSANCHKSDVPRPYPFPLFCKNVKRKGDYYSAKEVACKAYA